MARALPDVLLPLVGASLGVLSIGVYAADGYSSRVALCWLAALVLLGAYFLRVSEALPRIARLDLGLSLALLAAFAPIYLIGLYDWPVQVGSDEEVISAVAKDYGTRAHVDLFGVSEYFGSPAVTFVVWGKLASLLGGVNLQNMRLLPAVAGVLAVGLSYALFRQLLARGWAVLASVLFGVNHSFLMFSRLAMHHDFTVVLEVSALALLLLGLRKGHPFAMFCAGVVAGVGFYVHFSGRSVVLTLVAFLVVLAIWFRKQFGLGRLLLLSTIAAAGFVLVATPYVISYVKAPASLTAYQREAVLLYEAGRAHQQGWVHASSELAGYLKNVEFGLTAYNRPIQDHGWFYVNPGHGIVDPATGLLLWIGAAAALVRVWRSREPWPLLPLVAFLCLWLLCAFVINEAPDYPRMLATIPLVAYLATEGLRAAARLAGRVVRRSEARHVALVASCAGVVIVAWNGLIARDYLLAGRHAGDAIGSTGRYVQAHDGIPGVRFYLAADEHRWRYYDWLNDDEYRLRLFVADDGQLGGRIPPARLRTFRGHVPFAIFMNSDLWALTKAQLIRRYPQGRIRPVTPTGRLVVFQVFRPAAV